MNSKTVIVIMIVFTLQTIEWTTANDSQITCETITNSNLCIQIGYKFYLLSDNEKLNWWDAQRFCRSYNASLATIENSQEMRLISDRLIAKGYDLEWHYGGKSFWISPNDIGSQPGTFYSITNGNLLAFTAWTPGEPNNSRGIEHCVHLWYWDKSFGMNDHKCFEKDFFLCEFKERLKSDEPFKTAECII